MKLSSQNLIWIDLEMTGLNPEHDKIIEIATVITDKNLSNLVDGPNLAIYHHDSVLERMDEWNVTHHTRSGLLERVRASTFSIKEAEELTLEFIKKYVPQGKSPICGNTVYQDRRFLYRYMPTLEQYFHYRNLDVSTLKILAQRWYPRVYSGLKKKSEHLASADIHASINELQYYREQLFKLK